MRCPELLLLAGLAACSDVGVYDLSLARGRGQAPPLETPTRTESTWQTIPAKVDVLWVIDDSGSMSDEQDKLATNLPAFFDYLDGSGMDWHIGVTTTDAELEGLAGSLRRVAGYAWLSQDTPHVRELFEMLVRVGVGGSMDEMGLLAVKQGVFQPHSELIAANAGFLREDAGLHIVVISDEDDSSEDRVDPTELATSLRTMKADPEIPVTFNSIVGPKPNGCDSGTNQASYGSRYVVTTMRVGGIHRSICEDDWVPVLEDLGLQAAGLRDQYVLSQVPVDGSLQVVVRTQEARWEGVEVAGPGDLDAACAAAGRAPEACFGFRYDPVRNSVALVGFVPDKGALVRITYALLSGRQVVEEG
ncbi:MAG: VWA domain-containing protein [Alphaproteobacteria bacterium]|nr:VWA domain-containing protein [Alphaproteobacteria bacterium]